MAGVWKRPSDKARKRAGKWTIWYVDAEGRRRTKVGFTDKAKSEELAHKLESDARLIREKMVRREDVAHATHNRTPLADHVAAYRKHLTAKGDGTKHAAHVAGVLDRLIARAGFGSLADLAGPPAQAALAAMKAEGRSARTCNHALAAFRAFAAWLEDDGRLDRAPRGMTKLARFNEEADRKRVRRALTAAEAARLLAAAEAGAPVKLSRKGYQFAERWITGPERATIYRVAMETGFRAEEIRTLVVARFALDGPEPSVTVLAAYAKNGRTAAQPISAALAAHLRPLLAGRRPDALAFEVPAKTAKLLRIDLAAAGIPHETERGVVDFHALRHSFVTTLVNRGVSPKVAQVLARHSSVSLTLGRYAHAAEGDVRRAVEGGGQ